MNLRVWLLAGIASVTPVSTLATCAAVAASAAPAFELQPGVVVDSGRGAVYLMNPERGIDAIDLSSGKLLWRTASAGKPLLAFDDRLVAQAEASAGTRTLPLVVLNTMARGEPVKRATVPLPAPAFASIDDGMGTSFGANCRLSNGAVEVSWRFIQRSVTGFGRPGPPSIHETSGAARIDLKTGRSQSLRGADVPPQARATPLPAIALEPGFDATIASADGEMLLAKKPLGADKTGRIDYLWAIFALTTSQKIVEIRMPTPAAPFFVWNSKLFYVSRPSGRRLGGTWTEQPLELRALDLKTGAEAWHVPIRDTAYRGPYPPRP